jgi:uncharacterized damage-inducible protein DinB
MGEFENDLRQITAELDEARSNLLAAVNSLTDQDLERRRRGGWSIKDILLHVIGGERHYTNGICSLRGNPGDQPPQFRLPAIESHGDAVRLLAASRRALLAAVEGIEEDAFYRLAPLPNEEGHGQTYSVLSVLENIALHDREHAAQIRDVLATGSKRS